MPTGEHLHRRALWGYLWVSGQREEVERIEADRYRQLAAMSSEEILDADNEGAMLSAGVFAEAGEFHRAIELMEAVRYAPAAWTEREPDAALFLAALYQHVGRHKDAIPILAGIVAHLEREFGSGVRHPWTLMSLAHSYAFQGRDNEAIEMMEKAVDYHYRWGGCDWPDDPLHKPLLRLRYDSRVVALCERMETDLQQQANRVRNMLAEHDIDELLAPLMAWTEKTGNDRG